MDQVHPRFSGMKIHFASAGGQPEMRLRRGLSLYRKTGGRLVGWALWVERRMCQYREYGMTATVCLGQYCSMERLCRPLGKVPIPDGWIV